MQGQLPRPHKPGGAGNSDDTWRCTQTGTGIGVPFTGLRGFGNVVWYPVSSVSGDPGRRRADFRRDCEQKQRLKRGGGPVRLAVEFPRGQAPTVRDRRDPAALAVTEPAGPNEKCRVWQGPIVGHHAGL